MTDEEFTTICRLIASQADQLDPPPRLIKKLDRELPHEPTWRAGFRSVARREIRKRYGEVSDRNEVERLLFREYTIGYYGDLGWLIYRPSHHGGGGHKWLADDLVEEYGPRCDPWNWRVLQERAASSAGDTSTVTGQ